MNIDIDNQFHRNHRLPLTDSIFSFFIIYLCKEISIYNIQRYHTLFYFSVLVFIYGKIYAVVETSSFIIWCQIFTSIYILLSNVHGCNRRVINGKCSHQ
jgi:uncharacterized membrane protein